MDFINKQYSEEGIRKVANKLCYNNIWIINGEFHRTLGSTYENGFWYCGQFAEGVSNMKQYKRWLNLRIFL
jgi:hypothetical protein